MKKPIKLTVTEAAPQFGVSYPTLVAALKRMDLECGRGKRFPLSVLHKAVTGDLESERIRETRARADILEIERRQKEGELVEVEAALQIQRSLLAPWRQHVLELPQAMAAKCNPADPEHARRQLTEWVDRTLASIHKQSKEDAKLGSTTD